MFESAELGQKVAKAEYAEQAPLLRVAILDQQMALREAKRSMVVVVAGDDREGCNEVLNLLHHWMDPRYLQANALGEPTQEEAERPPFWRYWRALPEAGRIGLFLGGWTTEGIARRVRKELDAEGLGRWFEHVCRFERSLTDAGTLLVKIWLHLPKDEWKRRAKAAKKDGRRLRRADDPEAEIFDDYDKGIDLAEAALRATSTSDAPWSVIESTDDRSRNLAVVRAVLAALTERNASRGADEAPPSADAAVAAVAALDATRTVLDTVDLKETVSEADFDEKAKHLGQRLGQLAIRALDEGVSTVLVFEGWDAAGKGGAVRLLTASMDATLYRVVPTGAPNDEERAHHWLWRFWRQLPRKGRLTIFDRSWYGRVLVERVEGFATAAEWTRAYFEIRDFEEQLLEHGTVLCKFWLHIDQDEQLRRFKDREKSPYKQFKISAEDYRNRAKWREYELAVNDMVQRTSAKPAPWTLVAANDKRNARVRVFEEVCARLEAALK